MSEEELQKLYSDFKSWLNGLVEDDPIPYEIKSLSFFVNKNYEIGFSGSEETNPLKIDFGFYFPLESEFFYSQILIEFINGRKCENLKNKILDILIKLLKLYRKEENNIFKNKNIFYGFLFEKANLLK